MYDGTKIGSANLIGPTLKLNAISKSLVEAHPDCTANWKAQQSSVSLRAGLLFGNRNCK
jgi:hypothetical protein